MLQVKNIKMRDLLVNHSENELVFCEEENALFRWNNGGWQEIKDKEKVNGDIKISYRDLVINTISNFEPYKDEAKRKYQVLINAWNEHQSKEYYMLYAKELDYFTLFVKQSEENNCCLGKEIFECLNNIGDVIYIEDFTEDDTRIIFWVKTPEGKITEVYLFDYTEGVVPFL